MNGCPIPAKPPASKPNGSLAETPSIVKLLKRLLTPETEIASPLFKMLTLESNLKKSVTLLEIVGAFSRVSEPIEVPEPIVSALKIV